MDYQLRGEDLAWCVRRLPPRVYELLRDKGSSICLAGGYVRSCIANEAVNDIDLFSMSKDDAIESAKALAGTDLKTINTDNAVTVLGLPVAVQFIHRWTFASATDVCGSFDFTIAAAAIWWDGNTWVSQRCERFYDDLAAKRLVYLKPERDEDAGGSMLRVLKFYQRGYRIPLDSLSAVVARLVFGGKAMSFTTEEDVAKHLTRLLREIDPVVDPLHWTN